MRHHIFTRLFVIVTCMLGCIAVLISADMYVSSVAAETETSAADKETVIEIRAKKFSYTPNIITVNKGDAVRLKLVSEDVTHGLYLDGYELQMYVNPGQESELRFVADKTGRFNFRCSVTCGDFHPYMVGYLVVKPNSRFSTYVLLVVAIGFVSAIATMRNKEEKEENGQG